MASHAIDKLPRPARAVLDAVNAAYVLAARRAVVLSHKPSAPDSAGTDCGYNEWGKSMPHADSPW